MENKDDYNGQEEIYANAVRAGKRTYFFDVRSTKNNDYYLTITESKKKFDEDGNFHYQKHKIFLYKEDFEKFGKALSDAIQKIVELKKEQDQQMTEEISKEFTSIDFEDLGNDRQ